MPTRRLLTLAVLTAALGLAAAPGASASGCASKLLSRQQVAIIYGWSSADPFSVSCAIHQFGNHELADYTSDVQCTDGELTSSGDPTPCWKHFVFETGNPQVDVFRHATAAQRRAFPGYRLGSASGKRVGMPALIDAKHGLKGVGVPNSGTLYIQTGHGTSFLERTPHNGDLTMIILRVGTTYAWVKNASHVTVELSSGLPVFTHVSPETRETYLGAIAVAKSLRGHAAR